MRKWQDEQRDRISVGRVGVNAEQSRKFRLQCVQHDCILISVKMVLILAESGVDEVPLIRGEILADGQEIGACEHVVFELPI